VAGGILSEPHIQTCRGRAEVKQGRKEQNERSAAGQLIKERIGSLISPRSLQPWGQGDKAGKPLWVTLFRIKLQAIKRIPEFGAGGFLICWPRKCQESFRMFRPSGQWRRTDRAHPSVMADHRTEK